MKESIFSNRKSEIVIQVEDQEIGLRGYFVVDTTINGLSCGGLRILQDISLEELQDLARIMTLKQAFIGVNRGGARAGIVASKYLQNGQKQLLINRFGELIRPHLENRKFLCARDVGTTAEQIRLMYKHLFMENTATPASGSRSGYFTALSVLTGIRESLKFLNMISTGYTVAIEGFGKVGSALSRLLLKDGAKIIAISTIDGALYNENGLNVSELLLQAPKNTQWMERYSEAKRLPKEDLCELPVDVLCPCATNSTINTRNMERVKAKILCAGANNPVTFAADRYLFSKGVLYLPDFITNCGGVLGNAVHYLGLSEEHLEKLLRVEVASQLRHFAILAKQRGRTPRELAVKAMNTRIRIANTKGRYSTYTRSVTVLAQLLLRKGLLPGIIKRFLGYKHLQRKIGANYSKG